MVKFRKGSYGFRWWSLKRDSANFNTISMALRLNNVEREGTAQEQSSGPQ